MIKSKFKFRKGSLADLKKVYKAPSKDGTQIALNEIEEKTVSNWAEIISQFGIIFQERLEPYLKCFI